ncbi:hypothetical protein Goe21_02030 [Bacillus phage vB_BsuM-Goe21]|nr:hypothetical protein Goe21_02030 [Bacillus phage vB_BsuM-Goe21]
MKFRLTDLQGNKIMTYHANSKTEATNYFRNYLNTIGKNLRGLKVIGE